MATRMSSKRFMLSLRCKHDLYPERYLPLLTKEIKNIIISYKYCCFDMVANFVVQRESKMRKNNNVLFLSIVFVSSVLVLTKKVSAQDWYCVGAVAGYASSNVSSEDAIYLAERDWVRRVWSNLGSPWHRWGNAQVIEEDCPSGYSGYSGHYRPNPNDRYYCRVAARPCKWR